jgi:NADH-quinone oxidoreductase subunit J
VNVSLKIALPATAPETTLPGTGPLGLSFLGATETSPKGQISGVQTTNPPARTPVAYLLPFEIVSIHLLVVLVGAAYLARAKRRVKS